MDFERYGGRRYLLVLAIFIASNALLWFGKIPPETWAEVLSWSSGAYLVANVAQRHIEAKAPKAEE
mgnify:CR=1 FL=1